MGILEMLAQAASQNEESPNEATILPEAAIMRLREVAAKYAEQLRGGRFKIGDVVVPWKGGAIRGSGPHIVIDLRDVPQPDFAHGTPGKNIFGLRLDMRVISILRGEITTHWVESHCFDFWTPESETPAEA